MLFQSKCYIKKLIRQGFTFNKLLNGLKKSQYFSKEELDNLHNEKLCGIIYHCYKNVPYYTDLFKELKLTPENIKTKEDLKKLPFLDKDIVRENYDRLIAKNKIKILCNIGHTSGSTGTPAKYLRDYYSINFENAILWRLWQDAGDNNLKRITLRGAVIVPVDQKTPPFWEFNPANNELLMSSYHLSDKNAAVYLEKIKEFKPQILYAYPSTAYLLAKFVNNLNLKLSFKAIFTSSEMILDEQREYIENTFQCGIYDLYGQAERVVAIGQCENYTYHIIEDYSAVEIIDTSSGHELVGTHLYNYIMPLLRYKTGDMVELSHNKCSCGRNFREISKIYGRNISYIITPEGAQISAAPASLIPRNVNNLMEVQFMQEKIGELVINITTNGKFTENDKCWLIKNALEHTSSTMKIIINEVDSIPRGPNGKFQSVINKLTDSKTGELLVK